MPVSKMNIIRAVLAVANKYDLDMCQMDVETAFLNGLATEDIYNSR